MTSVLVALILMIITGTPLIVTQKPMNSGGGWQAGYANKVADDCVAEDCSRNFMSPDVITVEAANRQRLLDHLTKPANRQQNSDSLPIHVMVKFIPIKIHDLNEKVEVLESTVRFQLSWQDRRLTWEPEKFNNIAEYIVPSSAIWSPDVAILNSISDMYHVVRDTRFDLKVESTGRVWWHPTGTIKTHCKLNLQYFPFDRQRCKVVLESPTLDIRLMNLTLRTTSNPVTTVMYISGETWDLRNLTGHNVVKRLGSNTVFTRVEFVMHLQRARIYHLLNVIFPAIFLSLVQLMFFFMPATHPQRVGAATTTLLSVVVFHTMVASQLPKTSTDVPILAVFIFIVTFICGLSVATSILVAKFAVNADRKHELPRWIRRIRIPRALLPIFRRGKKWTFNSQHHARVVNHSVIHKHVVIEMSDEPEVVPLAITTTQTQPASSNKQDDDDDLMFANWNDVSHVVDSFLLIIATLMALLAPVILFVMIPSLVDHGA